MADSSGQATETPTKAARITDLKELFSKARSAKRPIEPDLYLNIAFYLGHQWTFWNRGRIDRPYIAPHRELVTDNRILPVASARAARKVKNKPVFVSTPRTADEEDIASSAIGEKVLDADWTRLGLQSKLFQAVLFAEICGAGFWKVYWDSTRGDSADFLFDASGQAVEYEGRPARADAFNGSTPEGLTARPVAQGDVCVDVISPFELYPDPLADSIETAEWVIEEKVRSKEYLRRRYGDKAKGVQEDADAPMGPVEARLFSSQLFGGATEYKGVKTYEYWARPSSDYPKGKRCVWAGDVLLAEEDDPFDPMPYMMFSGVRVPNRFWPTSVTTQLRGPQTELNKIHTQILENAKRIGNPSLLKSRQANVAFTGVPGEEVLFDSTVADAVPSYLQPPEVPVYVREQIDRITDSITEISGMHEVSKASVPSGVTAASAINLLQEADDTRLAPEIQDLEVALADAGTKILRLRSKFNDDERLIRLAGEDGNWDIFSFRGAMLRENTDVQVQAGSAMPRSKAAKQAAMMEVLQTAFQYGLPLDPRDMRQFFKDFEVAGLDRLFAAVGTDEMQVNREHRLICQGQAVPINEWDEDPYHVEGHDDFRKSARFARLPPQTQELMNVHVRAHRERLVQQTNLQMQAQQAEGRDQMMAQTAQQQALQQPPQLGPGGGPR